MRHTDRAMREEWLADGSQLSPWFLNLPVGSVEDFARLVKQLNDAQFANADPGYCTTTSYLVFDRAGTLVGASSLRHYLTLEGIRYFGHIGYGIRPGQRVAVFIGPEGGFAEAEIGLARESGVLPVTLGKRILRTETAGLAVLSWIMYLLEA